MNGGLYAISPAQAAARLEQLVESAHWGSVVGESRPAADGEFAYNIAAYKYRVDQEPRVTRRLSDLALWRDLARAGRIVRLRG